MENFLKNMMDFFYKSEQRSAKLCSRILVRICIVLVLLAIFAWAFDAAFPEVSADMNEKVSQMQESGMSVQEIDEQIYEMLFN